MCPQVGQFKIGEEDESEIGLSGGALHDGVGGMINDVTEDDAAEDPVVG